MILDLITLYVDLIDVHWICSMIDYDPHQSGFKDLIISGGLDLISDFSLDFGVN